MSNDLSAILPTAYDLLDTVSREMTGFIPAVSMSATAERVALNQPIEVPIYPAVVGEDIAASQLPPDTGDVTWTTTPVTITKSRAFPFRWSGEEQKQVNSPGGPGYDAMRGGQLGQALRAAVNEVEIDLATQVLKASRAYGTAGANPFGTNLSELAQALKILKDNGAPPSDLHTVLNTSAGASMRTLAQLAKANEAGDDTLLRQGTLMDIYGFRVRESSWVRDVTAGTGSGYLTNLLAGYAVGATSIAIDTGTGTVPAGTFVTFAGDTNKYMVKTGLTGGSIVLQAPGLRKTLADGVAMTVGGSYSAMGSFHRSAIVLAARLPAMPVEGDSAADKAVITDDRTGMNFELVMYKERRRVRYEVALAWGVAAPKPEFLVALLG